MILYLLICCTLILPAEFTGSVTSTKQKGSSNTSMLVKSDDVNGKNLTLPSEGGSVSARVPELTQSMDKANKLLELEADLTKAKDKSTVVARKGVTDLVQDMPIPNDSKNVSKKNDSVSNKAELLTKIIPSDKPKTLAVLKLTNSPEVPKKPLILSYEALVNADKNNANGIKIPATNPSSITKASNQIPSPNDDSIVKVYTKISDSHPDMIMPIVITILVVPMFAIVGYMALKRGKEAWKNRHYKRMDFLLDGMYND